MATDLPLFTRHGDSLIQVRVPVPLALKTVNSYFIRDDEGYIWIDPGLNTQHIQDFWTMMFSVLEISPNQIKMIICTHQHPDHFGLAGYAQRWTGAPVFLSKLSHQYAMLLWGEKENYSDKLSQLFYKHHVPEQLILDIVENLTWFKTVVYPFPNISELSTNANFSFSGEEWSVVETSGHAKGQMMLYNKQTAQIICGDQVLPHITPHVGVVPGEEDEIPLQHFLHNLNDIKGLSISEAFPGHGESFIHWSDRIEKILSHHERRLQKLEGLILEHGQLQAFEASNLVFGKHLHKQPQNLRFAITEMITHLDYLASRDNSIRKVELGDKLIYT